MYLETKTTWPMRTDNSNNFSHNMESIGLDWEEWTNSSEIPALAILRVEASQEAMDPARKATALLHTLLDHLKTSMVFRRSRQPIQITEPWPNNRFNVGLIMIRQELTSC